MDMDKNYRRIAAAAPPVLDSSSKAKEFET
jgi:hypothetical protein